jgi:hypothetical protein
LRVDTHARAPSQAEERLLLDDVFMSALERALNRRLLGAARQAQAAVQGGS